jgi:hypothetical protein
MSVFCSNALVTIVRGAGTDQETRWETQIGGDFRHTALFHAGASVKIGDELLSPWFDEPRVVVRVDPVVRQQVLMHWEATILPRSEWDRITQHQHAASPAHADSNARSGHAELANPEVRSSDPVQQASTAAQAIFRKEGAVWRASFNGKEILFPARLDGMDYIADLLRAPYKPIDAIHLARRDAVSSRIPPIPGIPLIDAKDLRHLRRVLAEKKDELNRLPGNDWTRRNPLEEEITKLEASLRQVSAHRGQVREVGGAAEKARKAVSSAIKRAIKAISGQHPDLEQHLAKSIKCGIELIYSPADLPDWQF